MAKVLGKRQVKKQQKLVEFSLDCSVPLKDKVFTLSEFEDYLRSKIKTNGSLNLRTDKNSGKVYV